jgi:hypothetical protein
MVKNIHHNHAEGGYNANLFLIFKDMIRAHTHKTGNQENFVHDKRSSDIWGLDPDPGKAGQLSPFEKLRDHTRTESTPRVKRHCNACMASPRAAINQEKEEKERGKEEEKADPRGP